MNPVLETILTVIQVIVCLGIIVITLCQNSKSEGLSSVSGAAETFFGKNGGRSLDAKLQKITIGLAIVFFLLTFILAIF